ncbi:hypothetical protein LR69_02805 [Geobacillus sp. BCO2]|nr:hypothetical protein LR69_02805 [Geobacillus sp. BCO2]
MISAIYGELASANSPFDLRVKLRVLLDSHFLFAHFKRMVYIAKQGVQPLLDDGVVMFKVISVEKLFQFFSTEYHQAYAPLK